MKVTHVVESFGGGVYEFLKLLTQNDNENIHTIIYSRRSEIPDDFIDDFKNANLIEINMQREINLRKDFKSAMDVLKLINENSPEILHLHSSKAGLYGRVIKRGLNKKIPIIYNPHGLSFLQTDISNKKRHIYKFVEKMLAIYSTNKIVGVSEQEYREISKHISKKKAVKINNGVKKNKSIIKDKKYDFVTVGRICEQKNPYLFNQFAQLFPNKKFLWIGEGDLRHILSSDNIDITGWIKDKDKLNDLLKSSKIYLQLSLWEGLPISLLEAMSIGLPCIVTDCIGLTEVVENAENGKIIEYSLENVENVVAEINAYYDKYSFNSKNAIDTIYSVNNMVKQYQDLYFNLICNEKCN